MLNEISCRVTAALINYLEIQDVDCSSLYSGLPYSQEYLLNPANWIPEPELNTIVDRAEKLTGRLNLMYELGKANPVFPPSVWRRLIRLFGSPRQAYARISRYAYLFNHNLRFQVDIIDRDIALIRLKQTIPGQPSRYACQYASGILTTIPLIWNLPPAEVKELYCPHNSALTAADVSVLSECIFEIRWKNPANFLTRSKYLLQNGHSGIHETIELMEKHHCLLNQKNEELVWQNKVLSSVKQIALVIDSEDDTSLILQKIVELYREIPGVGWSLLAQIDIPQRQLAILNYSKIKSQNIVHGLKTLGIDIEADPDTRLADFLRLSESQLVNVVNSTSNQQILYFDRLSQLLEGVWSAELCDAVQKMTGFKKYILMPLLIDHQNWFGLVLALSKVIPRDILEIFKSQTSIALKNTHTLEKLFRRNQALSTVNSIAGKIVQSLEISQIVDQTIQEVRRVFNAHSASIHMLDERTGRLQMIGQHGMSESVIVRSFDIDSQNPYFKLLHDPETVKSGKMPETQQINLSDCTTGHCAESFWYMRAVVIIDNKREGTLSVVRSQYQDFREDEKSLLRSICNHLAIAFQNARLHQRLLQRVNELEKARHDLSESDEKMRLTLDSISEAIMVASLSGKILQANRAAYRMHGFENDTNFVGKSALRYVVFEERRRLLENLKKIRETGVFRKAEYTLLKNNGTSFESECSISIYRNFLGIPIGFVICIRDISARKQTEKRLIENERRYRLITENTSDFIALITFGGYFAYVSPSFRQLGFEPTELINKSGLSLIHPDDHKIILPLLVKLSQMELIDLARLKKENFSQRLDYRVINKSGCWRLFDTTATIIETQDGRGYILLLVSRDMTDRKMAADELKTLYAKEKATSQALAVEINKRADFFRALVHELKTPLTPILVSSETLKDLAPDETYHNLAGNVYHSAMRLNNRIDELLDISRGEMGLLKLNLDPVDVSLVLKEIINYVRPQIEQNGQTLVTSIQEKLPYVNGEEFRLRQIMQNLLDNAMKFTPDNGQIYLEAIADETNLLIKVRDTGRGIDEKEQERIFQPYNRIESDRQHFSGLGLGLALCKQLVELHGGKLWIESQKNQGTTFSFTLPVICAASRISHEKPDLKAAD